MNLIDDDRFDWKPTKNMVGRVVRFGNGAVGTVLAPSPYNYKDPTEVRVLQFMDPEGVIDFSYIERLGFAEDYDMCYDYEIERTDPPVERLMNMLNDQVEKGDLFRLFQELVKAMSHGSRQRQDEDVWRDFRKLFPPHKRHP